MSIVLRTDEWNSGRDPRNGIRDHHQEDGERQQDGDAQRDLLSGVRRQAEADEDEDGQHDARQNDVHDVELVAALEMQLEDDVRVAAFVLDVQVGDGPPGLCTSHVPLAVLTEAVCLHQRRHVRYVHPITVKTSYRRNSFHRASA